MVWKWLQATGQNIPKQTLPTGASLLPSVQGIWEGEGPLLLERFVPLQFAWEMPPRINSEPRTLFTGAGLVTQGAWRCPVILIVLVLPNRIPEREGSPKRTLLEVWVIFELAPTAQIKPRAPRASQWPSEVCLCFGCPQPFPGGEVLTFSLSKWFHPWVGDFLQFTGHQKLCFTWWGGVRSHSQPAQRDTAMPSYN